MVYDEKYHYFAIKIITVDENEKLLYRDNDTGKNNVKRGRSYQSILQNIVNIRIE